GHAGEQAVAALRGFGVDVMFTLNGGHVWPLYEAAEHQGVRIVDTRHEQTATFAAEAWAKLTRRPGLAVLTAGPGVTNGVTALTPHRGPVFLDFPLDVFGPAEGDVPDAVAPTGMAPDLDAVDGVTRLIARADKPAFVIGSDVYWDGAWEAWQRAAERLRVP